MHILITGGSGFLGARLARTLLARGSTVAARRASACHERITLADRVAPPADLARDARVAFITGDLLALIDGKQAPAAGTDAGVSPGRRRQRRMRGRL
jgi:nucleoside-diphosphate-sugar epimerase